MSGTQPENDGIIPQKSLTDRDEMEKTGNGRKCESVDIKRSGSAEERGDLYNNNFIHCVRRSFRVPGSGFRGFFIFCLISDPEKTRLAWNAAGRCVLRQLVSYSVSASTDSSSSALAWNEADRDPEGACQAALLTTVTGRPWRIGSAPNSRTPVAIW